MFVRGAVLGAPTEFHHPEGASGAQAPPSTLPLVDYPSQPAKPLALLPGSENASRRPEHATCGISGRGAADSAPTEFHCSEGASGAQAPPSTLPLVDYPSQPAKPLALLPGEMGYGHTDDSTEWWAMRKAHLKKWTLFKQQAAKAATSGRGGGSDENEENVQKVFIQVDSDSSDEKI